MSKHILHKNRNGCALHGALKVVNAIDGFIPIIHSSAGCSIQSKLSENILTGSNGTYYRGWLEMSSTAVIEKEIVFGGTARLREQIKNTVKVQPAELYVVLTGCAPELVGDDIPAMVKEAKEQGVPIISISTPGFKGNVYKGYEWTTKAIIERISHSNINHNVKKGLVNILGIVPNQDIFWEGNLEGLAKTLALIGLESNTLFGFNQTKNNWRRVPDAELNIIVSPWGLESARLLEKKYGTPYLYLGYLPVGAVDTSEFLKLLEKKLSISEELIEANISYEHKYLIYQLQKLAQSYVTYNFQKEIALVGETSNVLGISRFLQNSFGQIVTMIIITDNPDIELRQKIKDMLPASNSFSTQLEFTSDGKEIDEWLLKTKPQVILGSSLEQKAADKLSVPLVKISSPVYDKIFLNHSYTGYDGAVVLLQDFIEALFEHLLSEQLKNKQINETPVLKSELKKVYTN